jgi:hypothetical protein
MTMALFDEQFRPPFSRQAARILSTAASVLTKEPARETQDTYDLRLTDKLREILDPPVASLGYTIEDRTDEWLRIPWRHSFVRNGVTECVLIHVPGWYFDVSSQESQADNIRTWSVVPNLFNETYKPPRHADIKGLYVFSEEQNDIPIIYEEGIFKRSWGDLIEIEGKFISWKRVLELSRQYNEGLIKDLFLGISLLFGLSPRAYSNLDGEDRFELTARLSRYDNLGFDGATRKAFLKTAGVDEEFIVKNITLGAGRQYFYASELVELFMNYPSEVCPLLKFLADNDPHCPLEFKSFIRELFLKYRLC